MLSFLLWLYWLSLQCCKVQVDLWCKEDVLVLLEYFLTLHFHSCRTQAWCNRGTYTPVFSSSVCACPVGMAAMRGKCRNLLVMENLLSRAAVESRAVGAAEEETARGEFACMWWGSAGS